jgi:hypothetical protein
MINSTLWGCAAGWLEMRCGAKRRKLSGLQIGEVSAQFGDCFAYTWADAQQGKSNEGETKWPRKP